MPEIDRYVPGTFCWVELATSDSKDAKRFYTELFGWAAHDQPIGGGQYYTMLRLRGKDVGALYQIQPTDQPSGGPPHWNSYVSVGSVDESVARAQELGGKIVKPGFDVMDAGRMAVIDDPTGASFCLWQANRSQGATVVTEPGAFCWNELATPNAQAAGDFYIGLFGWDSMVQEMGPTRYTTFSNQGRPAGGMYEPDAEDAGLPPSWVVYFAVADCDSTVRRAQELGASVAVPPADIPGIGRFATLADPQGAVFAIIKLANPPA